MEISIERHEDGTCLSTDKVVIKGTSEQLDKHFPSESIGKTALAVIRHNQHSALYFASATQLNTRHA